ncbi:MAG: hypothetical protein GTN90_16155, partial [Xanthomonadales bacterium]|nr:hypothetical protein [Xanthomonadales bacterium]
MIRELERPVASGYFALVVLILAMLGTGYWMYAAIRAEAPLSIIACTLALIVVFFLFAGLFIV